MVRVARELIAAARDGVPSVLAAVDRGLRSLCDEIDAVTIWELVSDRFTCTFASGPRYEHWNGATLSAFAEHSPLARARAGGAAQFVDDDRSKLQAADLAAIAVPLEDLPFVGYVAFAQRPSQRTTAALLDVCAIAAPALAIARDRAEDRARATYDGLTGLLTPRAFRTLLSTRLREAPRVRLVPRLALVFVDTDHFKELNDRYGHAAGDDLLRRLAARGAAPHALLRGYGGTARGLRRVAPGDDAAEVGDEALLLAAVAPTWIGADRAAAARAAVAAGADALVMDDGLQNPTLCKDVSLLVIDGGFGFGNGRLLPAGPLRESIAAAAARCRAAVLIGTDETGALAALPGDLPVVRARLAPGPLTQALQGRRVVAFAGIGRPAKFFATLREAGADVADAVAFADHHRFTTRELDRLMARTNRLNAIPVTTAKDAVRLPDAVRHAVMVADVTLDWHAPHEIEALLESVLTA